MLGLTAAWSIGWEACLVGRRESCAVRRFDSGARDFLWIFAGGYSQDFFHGWVCFVQKILQDAATSGLELCMA